jgi:two-component system response regulator CpxR
MASKTTTSRVKSVLVVDDDAELCALIGEVLKATKEFHVEAVHDGRRGMALALEPRFDLIILDVMLPVVDGFEVLEQIRKRSRVPVVLLTSRTERQDRVTGLDGGADDYLPKPFWPEELLARVRAVLRRSGASSIVKPRSLEVAGLRIIPDTRQVWINDQPIEITGIEFDILDVLARSAGRVVSRDEIAAVLYQRPSTPFERSLDVHISHLRKKLGSEGTLIQTIRNVGYVLVPAAEISR